MKPISHLLPLLTLLCLLAGCTNAPTTTPTPAAPTPLPPIDIDFTAQDYPHLDGSTSTFPLSTAILCQIFDVPCQWNTWLDGSKMLSPDLSNFNGDFPTVEHHGTHEAYVNLITGVADLSLVARTPSADELELASVLGVQLETTPIALDAFVFIVNRDNPIDRFTTQQIRAIYTGQLTNWQELGGADLPITPYQRNDNSGSHELMKKLVMQGLKMVDAPDLFLLTSMIAPFNAISTDPSGIGYSVYYYEANMAPAEYVKLCAVDGVYPDSNSIRLRSYPYTTEVYAALRTDTPTDHPARLLRDWLLTTTGQQTVAHSGYVPITSR